MSKFLDEANKFIEQLVMEEMGEEVGAEEMGDAAAGGMGQAPEQPQQQPQQPKPMSPEGKIYLVNVAKLALLHDATPDEKSRFAELTLNAQNADQIGSEIENIVNIPDPTTNSEF